MAIKDKLLSMGLGSALVIAATSVVIDSEGKYNKVYLDPKKIKTVCYGHTRGLKKEYYTDDECLEFLAVDLSNANDVLKNSSGNNYGKMTDNNKAAFISFIYNLGVGGKGVKDGFIYLKNGNHSTIYKKINDGDIIGACNEIPKWCKDCGELRGLKIRRNKEHKLCLRWCIKCYLFIILTIDNDFYYVII